MAVPKSNEKIGSCFDNLLDKEITAKDGTVMTGAEALTVKAFQQALKGDWKAWEIVSNNLSKARTKDEMSALLEAKQKETREAREKKEYKKLRDLFKDIPNNQMKLVDGLLHEASRLKVSCDDLWEDININGTVELFEQGKDSFERERTKSKVYTARNKAYQSIIRQLKDMLPGETTGNKLEEFLKDE